MTENHNSNADDEQPNTTPDSGHDSPDLDDVWSAFTAEHEADLNDVASSRQAKKFEKQAQRREKEALLSVDDLDNGTFTDDIRPMRERARRGSSQGGKRGGSRSGDQSGPRDFTGSSWLDTEDVMDAHGDDFVPPNPQIGPVKTSRLVFWILLIVGILGIICSVFVPSMAGILGTVFGVCTLIGGAGLLVGHKGYTETRSDYFDDGARV
jgi:hypothetical protein